jgi:hypothetical protein
MKKVFLILITLFSFAINVNAQDLILKRDGAEIKAKVLEITEQEIKYKEFDFQSGPTRNVNISDVFMITYENGQRDVFNQQTPTIAPNTEANVLPKMREVYWQGKLKYKFNGQKVGNPESLFYGMSDVTKNYRTGTILYNVGMGVWGAGFATMCYGIIDGIYIYQLTKVWIMWYRPIFWAGLGVATAGAILAGVGSSQIKTAVEIYNASIRKQKTTALSLNLGITPSGGIGFILNY